VRSACWNIIGKTQNAAGRIGFYPGAETDAARKRTGRQAAKKILAIKNINEKNFRSIF